MFAASAPKQQGRGVGRALAILLPLWLGLGCGSHSDSAAAQAELRVAECDAYAQRVAVCFHRDDLHDAIVTRARDEAERDRMRASCSQNLQRLAAACR